MTLMKFSWHSTMSNIAEGTRRHKSREQPFATPLPLEHRFDKSFMLDPRVLGSSDTHNSQFWAKFSFRGLEAVVRALQVQGMHREGHCLCRLDCEGRLRDSSFSSEKTVQRMLFRITEQCKRSEHAVTEGQCLH